ncbi:MAG: hypothetical protein WDM85_00500 [Caulobacteraceae bacterium]
MTTACALLGGVPMVLGNGTGSEFRQPARLGDYRRPDGLPDPDPVHHPGDLHLPGPYPAALRTDEAEAHEGGGEPQPQPAQ